MIKKIILTALFTIINAMTCAFTMKANVGLGAFDALSNSFSLATDIKVGYWIIILNVLILLISIIVQRKDFKLINLIQLSMPTLTGFVVNFFYYDLFKFEINGYFLRVIVFLISNIFSAFMVSCLLKVDLTIYPLEGLCKALEKKTNKKFGFYRTAADVIMLIMALLIFFIKDIPLQIREGTVISMCIYGPCQQLFYGLLNKYIKD